VLKVQFSARLPVGSCGYLDCASLHCALSSGTLPFVQCSLVGLEKLLPQVRQGEVRIVKATTHQCGFHPECSCKLQQIANIHF